MGTDQLMKHRNVAAGSRRVRPAGWLPGLLLAASLPSAWAQYAPSAADASAAEAHGPQGATPAQAEATGERAAAPKRALVIVPNLLVQETFTDNAVPGALNPKSDRITEISPGVVLDWKAARGKLHLDYKLRELSYAKGSRGSQTIQSLNSMGTVELVEKLFYVDVSGIITQQSVSAFGIQSPAAYSVNTNATETSNFRISPYFKGKIAGYADYEARYSLASMHSKSSRAADTNVEDWQGRIGGDTALAAIGWSVDANRQAYDYNQGRKTESDKFRGTLFYRFNPQWKLSVSAGAESNDFVSTTRQSWGTEGLGFDWTPSDRTQVSAFRESRFFGHGHTLSISHRMPLSAVKYTDSRDVSALPMQLTTVGLGNMYDLLFNQLASLIPDPAVRAAAVNDFLSRNNIPANSPVTGGFLSSQISLQRRQELSYMLRGARNTLTLGFTRSQNDRLGLALGSGDDFSLTSSIRQQGVNTTWSHQLSGLSNLNVMASRTHSEGSAGTNLQTTQKMLSASVSTRLGAKTTAVATLRRTIATSSTLPYSENAAVGGLSFQF